MAYADPPYPGKSGLYRGHPDYGGEVDHAELASRLKGFDGFALSTSAEALPRVLPLFGEGVRVAAWFRGQRTADASRPPNAWEPVIYRGARRVVRRRDPDRVIGAKPAAFCAWLFDLLDARADDAFHDLYPGSGGVLRAWELSCPPGGDASPLELRHASR
ncbi:MAG: hypothetical protein SangKO_031970 [Sandaracinaceae bacterium]